MKIEAKDSEIKRNGEVLHGRSNVIKKLEDEVRELKSLTDQLQEQKNEISKKLELAENSHSSISKVVILLLGTLGSTFSYKQNQSNCDQLSICRLKKRK